MSLQFQKFMQDVFYASQINRCLTRLDPFTFHRAYLSCVDKETVTALLHGCHCSHLYTVRHVRCSDRQRGTEMEGAVSGFHSFIFSEGISSKTLQRASSLLRAHRSVSGLDSWRFRFILMLAWHLLLTLQQCRHIMDIWLSSTSKMKY